MQASVKTNSTSIIDIDDCISKQIFRNYNDSMVNLFIDAGTVISIHSITILISTFKKLPFPFASVSINGYVTSEKYYDEGHFN